MILMINNFKINIYVVLIGNIFIDFIEVNIIFLPMNMESPSIY